MNFYIDVDKEFNLSMIDESGKNKLTLLIDDTNEKLISYLEYCARLKYTETDKKAYFSREIRKPEESSKGVYAPVEKEDITFWSLLGDNYDLIKNLFSKHPEGLPIYCKSVEQEREHLDFPNDLIPRRGAEEEHTSETNAEWVRKLHIALVGYEREKISKEVFKEYDSLKQELEFAIKSYEVHYNNDNSKSQIKFELKLSKVPVVGNPKFFKKAILSLILKQGGSQEIVCNKIFGFQNTDQEEAEYDWGLKLYREMLYEITNVCISTIIINRLQKNDTNRAS